MRKKIVRICLTAMFSAVGTVLMRLDIALPIFPSFLKLDLSDIPGLIGGFAFGPVTGVLICLFKNILHIPFSSSGGIGELANFIVSGTFVFTASIIYKRKKTKTVALIGMLVATIAMGIMGGLSNYFILIPLYTKFTPVEEIISIVAKIIPSVDSLAKVILYSIVPFNLLKGLITSLITFIVYKYISPVLHKIK